MNRTPSPQTLRKLADVVMRDFALRHAHPGLPVQTPAPPAHAVQMCDLPHVARHLLRLLQKAEKASARTLRRAVGTESDLLAALGSLIRHGLVEAVHRSYRITDAGSRCASAAQPH